MELNELRIGNYYYWSAEGKNYDLKVRREDFSNDNYKNFKPIPLTEEWLIKFGFEETDYAGDCYYLGSLQIDLSDFECAFNTNWLDCKTQYLHQLQNLYFALTGKELNRQKIN